MNKQFHPLPAPAISKIRKQYRKTKNKSYIVLVSTIMPFNHLDASSIYEAQYLPDYIERIDKIINSLSADVMIDFKYRPRMTHREHTFDVAGVIAKRFPHVEILEGDLDKQLRHAKLVIMDNPGSVLHKSIGANIPTLVSWNRDAWKMSIDFEVYIEWFKRLDIFFEDPTDLTKHLNKIHRRIPEWWNEPHRVNGVSEFSHEFARTSEHPLWDWMKYLWKI